MASNGDGGGGGGDPPAKKPLSAVKPKFAPRPVPRGQASSSGMNAKLPGALPNLLGNTTVKLEASSSSSGSGLDRERAVRGGRGGRGGRGRGGGSERGGRRPGQGVAPDGLNAPRVAFVASNTQSRSAAGAGGMSLAGQIKPSARTRAVKKEDDRDGGADPNGFDSLLKDEEEADDTGRKYEPIDYFGEVAGIDEEEAAGKLQVKSKAAVVKKKSPEESSELKKAGPQELSLVQYLQTSNVPAFIQFPAKLPVIPPKQPDKKAVENNSEQKGAETVVDTDKAQEEAAAAKELKPANDLSTFGTGKLGTLRVYRSGKVKLVIGNVEYELTNGVPYPFEQDLATIDPANSRFTHLGQVQNRIVCSIDPE
jgi:hypothetical protein